MTRYLGIVVAVVLWASMSRAQQPVNPNCPAPPPPTVPFTDLATGEVRHFPAGTVCGNTLGDFPSGCKWTEICTLPDFSQVWLPYGNVEGDSEDHGIYNNSTPLIYTAEPDAGPHGASSVK
jgi:hypothetical protein